MDKFLCLVVLPYIVLSHDFKWLQGPPEQFDSFSLPTALQTAESSSAELLKIGFENPDLIWQSEFYVDSETKFAFCLGSPLSDRFDILLKLPSSNFEYLAEVVRFLHATTYVEMLGINTYDRVPIQCFSFQTPPQGEWEVEIRLKGRITY
jgi:hypothetical protein